MSSLRLFLQKPAIGTAVGPARAPNQVRRYSFSLQGSTSLNHNYSITVSRPVEALFASGIVKPIGTPEGKVALGIEQNIPEINPFNLTQVEAKAYIAGLPSQENLSVNPQAEVKVPGKPSSRFEIPLGYHPKYSDKPKVILAGIQLQAQLWRLVLKQLSGKTSQPQQLQVVLNQNWDSIQAQVDRWLNELHQNPKTAGTRLMSLKAGLNNIEVSGEFDKGNINTWANKAERFAGHLKDYTQGSLFSKTDLFRTNPPKPTLGSGIFLPATETTERKGDPIPEKPEAPTPDVIGDPIPEEPAKDDQEEPIGDQPGNKKIIESKDTIDEVNDAIDEVENRIKDQEDERDDFINKRKQELAKRNSLRKRIGEIDAELEPIAKELDPIEGIQREIDRLDAEIRKRRTSQNKVTKPQDRRSIQGQIDRLEEDKNAEVKKLNEARQNSDIPQLRRERNRLNQERETHGHDLADVENEIGRLQKEIDKLNEGIASDEYTLKIYKSDRDRIQGSTEEQASTIPSQTEPTADSRKSEIENKIQAKKNELDRLEKELETLKSNADDLRKRKLSLKDQLKQHKRELEETRKREQEIQEIIDEIDSLQRKIDANEEKSKNPKNVFDTVKAHRDNIDLERRKRELEQELRNPKNNIDEVRNRIDTLNREIDSIPKNLDSINEELAINRKEKENISDEIYSVKRAIRQLEDALERIGETYNMDHTLPGGEETPTDENWRRLVDMFRGSIPIPIQDNADPDQSSLPPIGEPVELPEPPITEDEITELTNDITEARSQGQINDIELNILKDLIRKLNKALKEREAAENNLRDAERVRERDQERLDQTRDEIVNTADQKNEHDDPAGTAMQGNPVDWSRRSQELQNELDRLREQEERLSESVEDAEEQIKGFTEDVESADEEIRRLLDQIRSIFPNEGASSVAPPPPPAASTSPKPDTTLEGQLKRAYDQRRYLEGEIRAHEANLTKNPQLDPNKQQEIKDGIETMREGVRTIDERINRIRKEIKERNQQSKPTTTQAPVQPQPQTGINQQAHSHERKISEAQAELDRLNRKLATQKSNWKKIQNKILKERNEDNNPKTIEGLREKAKEIEQQSKTTRQERDRAERNLKDLKKQKAEDPYTIFEDIQTGEGLQTTGSD